MVSNGLASGNHNSSLNSWKFHCCPRESMRTKWTGRRNLSSRKVEVCCIAKSSFTAGSSSARLVLLMAGPYAKGRLLAFMKSLFFLANCSVITLNAILCNKWIFNFFWFVVHLQPTMCNLPNSFNSYFLLKISMNPEDKFCMLLLFECM